MADEYTDVTTIVELAICCRWMESSVQEEHFIEILPLKKANAESIYSALVEYCIEKNTVGKAHRNGIRWSCFFLG